MSTSPPRTGKRQFLIWAAALALLAGGGVAAWWWWSRPQGDLTAVLRANNRGIGFMEQFKYAEAARTFEDVVRLDPDWLPGRINLGIALLNDGALTPQSIGRAVDVFQEVLRRDPNNLHAHFCLGIIYDYQARPELAIPQFQFVTRKDPDDPSAWYYLGKQYQSEEDQAQAQRCFERAVELDPYLNAAIYGLAMLYPGDDPKRKQLVDQSEALRQADWHTLTSAQVKYSEMGRYAEVIGRPDRVPAEAARPLPVLLPPDKPPVQLESGVRWANRDDLRKADNGELLVVVRGRFGAALVLLDYNRDGKLDLFLPGAVVEGGKVRDLLLRNDDGARFTDVTREAGLAEPRGVLGSSVGDFDNDGRPDLLLTGAGRLWLFRNAPGDRFQDVTTEAGLDKLDGVALGSAFVDLDQDGDLDLVVARYAATAPEAHLFLTAPAMVINPGRLNQGLAVFLNIGEAVAKVKSDDPPPLNPKFRRLEGPAELAGPVGAAVAVVVTDLDRDNDLDLLVLADRGPAVAILNGRLLRFHRVHLVEAPYPGIQWNGGLVLASRYRLQQSDLFLIRSGSQPGWLQSLPGPPRPGTKLPERFLSGATNAPPLRQALAVDLDLDGKTDVVGLSEQGKPVLLHNDGERLAHTPEGLGSEAACPADLVAVAVADLLGDTLPDLLTWSESGGIQIGVNQGNGNHALGVIPTGHRRVDKGGMPVRTNADGVGVWVMAQAGGLWTGVENTTLSAGLGQSRTPLILGLGGHVQADVLRLRWPDNVWQALLDVPSGVDTRVEESNRKTTSCPILFTWDGKRFVFVNDFLGEGTVGEMLPGGGHRPPRPEEAVKIEPHHLAVRDGQYVLKVAEPMDEVVYLDRLQLVVLDHPRDVKVHPDERFAAGGTPPTQDLLAFREEIFPQKVRDERGRDVTAVLRAWDRATVDDFPHRTWLGFAGEHAVELDFGDRLAKFGPADRLVLCVAGWTDYPYPESIWAAKQAGVEMEPPVLERLGDDGRWKQIAIAGFPAGLPKMTTLEVTGQLTGSRCVLRLRTNMQVYWDQVFVAPLLERTGPDGGIEQGPGHFRPTRLEVQSATLSARGCAKEFSPDGRDPTLYDHDRLEAVPVVRMSGRLTRLGVVTDLLRGRDDCFVLFGPGDEVEVRFDARRLPPVPEGWTRSFVLRTWGYCKDAAPFTATGGTVEPLPFRAMSNYPYGPGEHYPHDAAHEEYRRRFNTRAVGPAGR